MPSLSLPCPSPAPSQLGALCAHSCLQSPRAKTSVGWVDHRPRVLESRRSKPLVGAFQRKSLRLPLQHSGRMACPNHKALVCWTSPHLSSLVTHTAHEELGTVISISFLWVKKLTSKEVRPLAQGYTAEPGLELSQPVRAQPTVFRALLFLPLFSPNPLHPTVLTVSGGGCSCLRRMQASLGARRCAELQGAGDTARV